MVAVSSWELLLKMPSLDVPALRQAMDRIFAAYASLRDDLTVLMACDVFVVEDVMMNSFYAQGLRALARLYRLANEGARIWRTEFRLDDSSSGFSIP